MPEMLSVVGTQRRPDGISWGYSLRVTAGPHAAAGLEEAAGQW
ncbi:hypothetical protein ACIOHS_00895 [Streptomyces sp. NPDC088253]